jgi:hypothetical protein
MHGEVELVEFSLQTLLFPPEIFLLSFDSLLEIRFAFIGSLEKEGRFASIAIMLYPNIFKRLCRSMASSPFLLTLHFPFHFHFH